MLASAMWVVISQCLTGSELSIRNLQPFVFGDLLQYGTDWRKDDVNQCLEYTSRVKALSLALLSPFLIERMFVREPSWKYSAKLYSGSKSFAHHVLGTFALFDQHCL